MKVVLTRGLWIDNKSYPAGLQEIPEAILKGKTFHHHIEAGHIVEAKTVRQTAVKSQKEHADMLLEKLHSKQLKNATPEQAAGLEGGVTEAAPVESESEAKPSRRR
jgi:hypothetical protein